MWQPKIEHNLGGLWRSAFNFDAAFIYTIGSRYRHQASDVTKTPYSVPLHEYKTEDEFLENRPYACQLVAVEIVPGARPLETFCHPERCIYLLGGEDRTLPARLLDRCQAIIKIATPQCLNVAQAGTVVMYDRHQKQYAVDEPIPFPTMEIAVATGKPTDEADRIESCGWCGNPFPWGDMYCPGDGEDEWDADFETRNTPACHSCFFRMYGHVIKEGVDRGRTLRVRHDEYMREALGAI